FLPVLLVCAILVAFSFFSDVVEPFALQMKMQHPLCGHHQLTEIYCVSRNSFSPSCAPSRPMPLCFMPPNGAAGSDTRPPLSPIMPKSSFSDTRMPRPMSLV